ncbi:MAG: hypothetical protein KDA25_10640 [Phycisphaerales bacterium]|nr:hypothetical protein [Phycisphaerales bacterium]
MPGLFAGTPLERPVTCAVCGRPRDECTCPRDATGAVRPPASQTATIRLVKRRHARVVTTIEGLDAVATDLGALAKTLRQTCGTGGTVADDTVELQGDHRDAAARLLRERGYTVRVA